MKEFTYRALMKVGGNVVEVMGTMDAETREDVRKKLESINIRLIEIMTHKK